MSSIKYIGVFLIFLSVQLGYSQYASTRINENQRKYVDSLKNVEYKALLPLWGQEAYKRGFDLPYPTGVMVNYVYVDQGLFVGDMKLGLLTSDRDIPLTDTDFIQFADNRVIAETVLVRPDIWLLPFLNVYGLFGIGSSATEVNLTFPFEMKTLVEQEIRSTGIGATAAAGVGPVWLALDGNISWNKPQLLEKPVKITSWGIRMGTNFVNKNKPYRNFGIWVGAMGVEMGNYSVGELRLGDALPQETWDRADEIVAQYYDWYENEATIIQKKIADEVLTPIVERIDAADGSSIVRFGLNKALVQKWNGVIGAQYQPNKNWMFRTEAGVVGDRKSFMLSVNYRFLLTR